MSDCDGVGALLACPFLVLIACVEVAAKCLCKGGGANCNCSDVGCALKGCGCGPCACGRELAGCSGLSFCNYCSSYTDCRVACKEDLLTNCCCGLDRCDGFCCACCDYFCRASRVANLVQSEHTDVIVIVRQGDADAPQMEVMDFDDASRDVDDEAQRRRPKQIDVRPQFEMVPGVQEGPDAAQNNAHAGVHGSIPSPSGVGNGPRSPARQQDSKRVSDQEQRGVACFVSPHEAADQPPSYDAAIHSSFGRQHAGPQQLSPLHHAPPAPRVSPQHRQHQLQPGSVPDEFVEDF